PILEELINAFCVVLLGYCVNQPQEGGDRLLGNRSRRLESPSGALELQGHRGILANLRRVALGRGSGTFCRACERLRVHSAVESTPSNGGELAAFTKIRYAEKWKITRSGDPFVTWRTATVC